MRSEGGKCIYSLTLTYTHTKVRDAKASAYNVNVCYTVFPNVKKKNTVNDRGAKKIRKGRHAYIYIYISKYIYVRHEKCTECAEYVSEEKNKEGCANE